MGDISPDPIARLTALVVGEARWRLALGEAFERLGELRPLSGPRALGFSSMAACAVERCGTSGRWVEVARGARAAAGRAAAAPEVALHRGGHVEHGAAPRAAREPRGRGRLVVEAMLAETLTSLLPSPDGEGGAAVLRALDRAADAARFRAEGQAAQDAARGTSRSVGSPARCGTGGWHALAFPRARQGGAPTAWGANLSHSRT